MDDARAAAEQYVRHMPDSLKGRLWRIAVLTTEEDCRFFYPRRSLIFQQKLTTALSRAIRSRKGKVQRITFTEAECRTAIGADADDPRKRRDWLESHLGLDPEPKDKPEYPK